MSAAIDSRMRDSGSTVLLGLPVHLRDPEADIERKRKKLETGRIQMVPLDVEARVMADEGVSWLGTLEREGRKAR